MFTSIYAIEVCPTGHCNCNDPLRTDVTTVANPDALLLTFQPRDIKNVMLSCLRPTTHVKLFLDFGIAQTDCTICDQDVAMTISYDELAKCMHATAESTTIRLVIDVYEYNEHPFLLTEQCTPTLRSLDVQIALDETHAHSTLMSVVTHYDVFTRFDASTLEHDGVMVTYSIGIPESYDFSLHPHNAMLVYISECEFHTGACVKEVRFRKPLSCTATDDFIDVYFNPICLGDCTFSPSSEELSLPFQQPSCTDLDLSGLVEIHSGIVPQPFFHKSDVKMRPSLSSLPIEINVLSLLPFSSYETRNWCFHKTGEDCITTTILQQNSMYTDSINATASLFVHQLVDSQPETMFFDLHVSMEVVTTFTNGQKSEDVLTTPVFLSHEISHLTMPCSTSEHNALYCSDAINGAYPLCSCGQNLILFDVIHDGGHLHNSKLRIVPPEGPWDFCDSYHGFSPIVNHHAHPEYNSSTCMQSLSETGYVENVYYNPSVNAKSEDIVLTINTQDQHSPHNEFCDIYRNSKSSPAPYDIFIQCGSPIIHYSCDLSAAEAFRAQHINITSPDNKRVLVANNPGLFGVSNTLHCFVKSGEVLQHLQYHWKGVHYCEYVNCAGFDCLFDPDWYTDHTTCEQANESLAWFAVCLVALICLHITLRICVPGYAIFLIQCFNVGRTWFRGMHKRSSQVSFQTYEALTVEVDVESGLKVPLCVRRACRSTGVKTWIRRDSTELPQNVHHVVTLTNKNGDEYCICCIPSDKDVVRGALVTWSRKKTSFSTPQWLKKSLIAGLLISAPGSAQACSGFLRYNTATLNCETGSGSCTSLSSASIGGVTPGNPGCFNFETPLGDLTIMVDAEHIEYEKTYEYQYDNVVFDVPVMINSLDLTDSLTLGNQAEIARDLGCTPDPLATVPNYEPSLVRDIFFSQSLLETGLPGFRSAWKSCYWRGESQRMLARWVPPPGELTSYSRPWNDDEYGWPCYHYCSFLRPDREVETQPVYSQQSTVSRTHQTISAFLNGAKIDAADLDRIISNDNLQISVTHRVDDSYENFISQHENLDLTLAYADGSFRSIDEASQRGVPNLHSKVGACQAYRSGELNLTAPDINSYSCDHASLRDLLQPIDSMTDMRLPDDLLGLADPRNAVFAHTSVKGSPNQRFISAVYDYDIGFLLDVDISTTEMNLKSIGTTTPQVHIQEPIISDVQGCLGCGRNTYEVMLGIASDPPMLCKLQSELPWASDSLIVNSNTTLRMVIQDTHVSGSTLLVCPTGDYDIHLEFTRESALEDGNDLIIVDHSEYDFNEFKHDIIKKHKKKDGFFDRFGDFFKEIADAFGLDSLSGGLRKLFGFIMWFFVFIMIVLLAPFTLTLLGCMTAVKVKGVKRNTLLTPRSDSSSKRAYLGTFLLMFLITLIVVFII